MNSDAITNRLRALIESTGVHIRATHHPSSLRVEFTTSPPLTWTWGNCDTATRKILDSPLATPDEFGCHPEGQTPGTIGDLFSTDHDRSHSYWRFRLETSSEPVLA